MLLVETTIGPSPIHGTGLFAAQPIAAGTPTWGFHQGLDLVIPAADYAALPEPARRALRRYAYRSQDSGDLVLCADDARFFNHADEPTTTTVRLPGGGYLDVAARDLAVGDELTCDYRTFDADWREKLMRPGSPETGPASGASASGTSATDSGATGMSEAEPLCTVGPSGVHGAGAFARRAIRAGEVVVVCGGVRVRDEQIPPGARAMQIGEDLYLMEDPASPGPDDSMNHSCEPNLGFVRGDPVLFALRDIAAGEELTFDYSTTMGEEGWSIECRCGRRGCRGRVTNFGDLSDADRARLEPVALAYLRSAARER